MMVYVHTLFSLPWLSGSVDYTLASAFLMIPQGPGFNPHSVFCYFALVLKTIAMALAIHG
ncbi:hypothetical protein DFH09DRAFT_253754 [Mycena vulgaris]|nr:hypothetical protein DFH09DRAFT_253754 [Mycena vulgaris]